MTGERNGNGLIARLDFYIAMVHSRMFSSAARDVAHALLYLHMNGTTGRCDPAIPTLAGEVGLEERSVKRAIHELKASGWWQVISHGSGAGRGNTNSYRPVYEKAVPFVPDVNAGKKVTALSPFEPGTGDNSGQKR
jgi:hypothetical protein